MSDDYMTSLSLRGDGRPWHSTNVAHAPASSGRQRDEHRVGGSSLLELVAALGVASIAAGLCGGALTGVSRAIAVEAARVRATTALLEGRRLAYSAGATVEVAAAAGDTVLTIRTPAGDALPRSLPAGTVVLRAPASGGARFFASGMADNATFVVGSSDGDHEARIVLNQRGLVR